MTDTTTHAPINWVTTILFSTTFVAAVVGVPLYGWLSATGRPRGCGSAFSSSRRVVDYRRVSLALVITPTRQLVGARLLHVVRRMTIQNSIYIWAAGHRRTTASSTTKT
jgi:hypothetical protein